MKDFTFGLWNRILGWFCFAVALFTYVSTVAPTASFWDAGEYIATSAKLEVGHPPGAPLFQMLGAFFATFAPSEEHIALMVNLVSSVSSAFTILFLFWSISLLLRKITGPEKELGNGKKMAVLGSALVGALGFTFTDSFWFSAVEAEVYGTTSFLMAVLFYVGLLWERDMFKPRGNRWLILIAFIIGLSFGVHFMALLTIPAIGFLYFFKNVKKVTVLNFIITNIVVVAILMFIFKLLMPYALKFFAATELFFVNSLGLPFNSGTIFAFLVLIGFFFWSLTYTRKKNLPHFNTILLCILFIFIGFSCYIMLPIRSSAKTTINENSPDSARELLSYYQREQYPKHGLFYGKQFTAQFGGLDQNDPFSDGEPLYEQNYKTGEYEIVNDWKNAEYNSSDQHKTILPRMWSSRHMKNYLKFTGPLEVNVKPQHKNKTQLIRRLNKITAGFSSGKLSSNRYLRFLKRNQRYLDIHQPTMSENLSYLFEYQIGYMFFRYFFWNFVGRQDDMQGKYGVKHGNWLSGIDFIDAWHLRPQDHLPEDVLNNPGRNTYYFLPLILGLIGFFFQMSKDKKNWWVVFLFFVFTGLALAFYLNARPFEPRERHYAFVGSFYVFAIWMGFGVYAIFNKLQAYIKPKIIAPVVTAVCLLAAPVLLASQNWNDHDRSLRYSAAVLAKMYLSSVDENGILFTIGDNDTFPLWYIQEIEGYRTDVRVINTSLFATSWYIRQMQRQAYNSPPVKMQFEEEDYVYGTNGYVRYHRDPRIPDTLKVESFIAYVKSDNPSTQVQTQNGQTINLFPTKNLRLPVKVQNALKNDIVDRDELGMVEPYIPFRIQGNNLAKNELMMLDIVGQADWKRPIYFSGGSYSDDAYLWMKEYLELNGLTYQLVPIKTKNNRPYTLGRIDTEEMYKTVMNWDWGNMGHEELYHDVQTRRNSISFRKNLSRLASELIKKGKKKKAKDILDLAMEKMPIDIFGHYSLIPPYISMYFKIGEGQTAMKYWHELAHVYQDYLDYYVAMNLRQRKRFSGAINKYIRRYRRILGILQDYRSKEQMKDEIDTFNSYAKQFKNVYRR